MNDNYRIAWVCLLRCLRNGYSLDIWFSPIPEEHKEKMIKAGKRFIEREQALAREPSLF